MSFLPHVPIRLTDTKISGYCNGLASLVEVVPLERLNLSLGNLMCEIDYEALVRMLRSSTSLLHLDISNNEFPSVDCVRMLMECLVDDNKTLEELDLSHCHVASLSVVRRQSVNRSTPAPGPAFYFGDYYTELLGRMLVKHASLKYLNLSGIMASPSFLIHDLLHPLCNELRCDGRHLTLVFGDGL